MVGDTYLERGRPVIVLVAWVGKSAREKIISPPIALVRPELTITFNRYGNLRAKAATAPRNVLIQREDGSLVIRPFRGLRKPKGDTDGTDRTP